jgi:diacylglycerol kinase family enzyme
LSLSDKAKNDDGKFEVTTFKSYSKLKLLKTLTKASTTGLNTTEQRESYEFETTKKLLVQLDGEIHRLDANTNVTIGVERQALSCIV